MKWSANGFGTGERWQGAARIVLLLAFAAFVVQLGWSAFAPAPRGARSQTLDNERSTEIASPFTTTSGTAFEDTIDGVRLVGVRMADNPAQSGAVLALANGEQRAVAVGQEIGLGVRVAEIQAGYIRLTSENESIVLPLGARPTGRPPR